MILGLKTPTYFLFVNDLFMYYKIVYKTEEIQVNW